MGQILGRSDDSGQETLVPVETASGSSSLPTTSRKRKTNDAEENVKRNKISKLDTPKYIHKRLFVEGTKSDVTICALGRTWNLHRLYLEQCKFFDCLFRGSWKESNDSVLHLKIVDPAVTPEGLNKILESLYHNEIEIDLDNIEGLVAAASMLSLESVLERCSEVCIESLSDYKVLSFSDLADKYGLPDLSQKCFEYLKCSFWRLSKETAFLAALRAPMMLKLVSADDLLVVEGEIDVYETVKKWIFLQQTLRIPDATELESEVKNFYSSVSKRDGSLLLAEYAEILSYIRVPHIVTSLRTLKEIHKDPLIPDDVLDKVVVDAWVDLLSSEEGASAVEVTDELFNANAYRYGRVITSSPKCWRWSGFNFGIDVLLNFNHGIITMKRNCLSQTTPCSVNLKTDRRLHYRIIIMSSNGRYLFDSQRQSSLLRIDQSTVIARLPAAALTFPISVHFFLLTLLPGNSYRKHWEPYLTAPTHNAS